MFLLAHSGASHTLYMFGSFRSHQLAERHLAGSSSTATTGTLSTPASVFINPTYSDTASCCR